MRSLNERDPSTGSKEWKNGKLKFLIKYESEISPKRVKECVIFFKNTITVHIRRPHSSVG
jgi:hypothetical protein